MYKIECKLKIEMNKDQHVQCLNQKLEKLCKWNGFLTHNDVEHNENLQKKQQKQREHTTQNLQENENFGKRRIN